MDIKKIKALNAKIEEQARLEIFRELPSSVINLNLDSDINYSLKGVKTKNLTGQSARVINNWINKGLIQVEDVDKGKINRFTREEAIWMLLVEEFRAFGLSLSKIKQLQNKLFIQPVAGFYLFRHSLIWTILGGEQFLIIFPDSTFSLLSKKSYERFLGSRTLTTHLLIDFKSMIKKVFTCIPLTAALDVNDFMDDVDCMKILFYIKSGLFERIIVNLGDNDLRFIENSGNINLNSKLIDSLKRKEFNQVEIFADNQKIIIENA